MASTCPACGAAAFDGSQCARCGYAAGEANRCPHCGAVARIEGSGRSAVCAMCGGPRIPHNHGGEAAARLLKEQKAHLAAARVAGAATVLQGVFATVAALVGLALMPAALVGKLVVLAVAVAPLVLAMRSRSRAKAEREAAREAGDRAWQTAAEAIAAGAPDGITAGALAKRLVIEEADADRLLTALAVHDRTRIDVGDDAEVVYRTRPREEDEEPEAERERVR